MTEYPDPYSCGIFPVRGSLSASRWRTTSLDRTSLSQRISQAEVAGHCATPLNGPSDCNNSADMDGSISSFIAQIPTNADDPTRLASWTKLIRLKTRSIELAIAQARQKEREAEVELVKLRAAVEPTAGLGAALSNNGLAGFPPIDQMGEPSASLTPDAFHSFDIFSLGKQAKPATDAEQSLTAPISATGPHLDSQINQTAYTPMTSYDLETMMLHSNMDNLFSWLPEFNEVNETNLLQPAVMKPSDLLSGLPDLETSSGVHTPNLPDKRPFDAPKPSLFRKERRSSSATSASSIPPPAKKTKRGEKKVVIECSSTCLSCARSLARILVRAPKAQVPEPILVEFRCLQCLPVATPAVAPDAAITGTGIGTVVSRKTMRAQLELEDDVSGGIARRVFCDVCQKIIGSGRVVGGERKEYIGQTAEVICASCDSKYQRCTDCGGGGGPRAGIGKWRMKQVFPPGRKTCTLSHSRLGDRLREIGVHVTPTDFTPQQLREVLVRCKGLWKEKTLSRLAVPEMLEIDLPSDVTNPLRHYDDVEDIVKRNWPTREAMIQAEGADPNRFKRVLGLTWAHAKPRKNVRSIDLEKKYAKVADDNDDMSTVLANVKRTKVVIPAGSELVGMWGGEWDMHHGSLLISTLIPFEGTDGEDTTALSVGEMISKVQNLQQSINAERRQAAQAEGKEPDLLPQCEHLWVVSGGSMPLVRERMTDILIRKRSFVHVEEYLTRHPDFIHALQARPAGLHPDLHRPLRGEGVAAKPLILVRWLGKNFDAQKTLEIKQQEFGGKAKLRKRSRNKV